MSQGAAVSSVGVVQANPEQSKHLATAGCTVRLCTGLETGLRALRLLGERGLHGDVFGAGLPASPPGMCLFRCVSPW